ncbi:MAG: hypothetical protein J6K81_07350, partial [Rikenellaceae bacterium]|nr:hypothetical protein [Rikenellaceae bacterium]
PLLSRNNKVLLVEPKRTKRLFAFRFFVVCVKSLAKSAAVARYNRSPILSLATSHILNHEKSDGNLLCVKRNLEKRSFSSPGLRVVFGSFVDTKEHKRVALPPFVDTKEHKKRVGNVTDTFFYAKYRTGITSSESYGSRNPRG